MLKYSQLVIFQFIFNHNRTKLSACYQKFIFRMKNEITPCWYQIVGLKHRFQKCCVCAERSESHHKVMATKLKQACSIIHFSIRLKIQSSDGLPIFRWRCVVPKHQSFVALLFFYYSIHQIVYGLWVQRRKMRHTQSTNGFKMGLSEREKNVQWKQIGYAIKQKAVAQSNEKKTFWINDGNVFFLIYFSQIACHIMTKWFFHCTRAQIVWTGMSK